jgi:hypothetical protein
MSFSFPRSDGIPETFAGFERLLRKLSSDTPDGIASEFPPRDTPAFLRA